MDATNRPSQQLLNAQKELAHRRRLAGVSTPVRNEASGFQSAEVASVPSEQGSVFSVQTTANIQQPTINEQYSPFRTPHSAFDTQNSAHPTSRVRISPTLAAHCLNRQHRYHGASQDAPYRLYKILGALDENGRGWLANSEVEPLLTKKGSPFYIYGRRQLKAILRRGEGLFWQRVKSKGQLRIRLVSRAKLLEALSPGSRLRGREVEIPLFYLLGSGRGRQADANAALYAAVHAGRLRPDRSPSGVARPRPISRARLQELAGCSTYRQRSYERRLNITVERNIQVLGSHSDYELERVRQHLSLPAYKHIDYQGKINRHRRGAAYIAVRLPNSYHLPDAISVIHSRRQRTINRSLDGLCHMGSGGSDREAIVRLYHRDAATAVRAYQQDSVTPAYWPVAQNSNMRLWQTIQVRSNDFNRQSGELLTTSLSGREKVACRERGFIPHSARHQSASSQTRHSKGVI